MYAFPVSLRRLLAHGFVLCYLALTASAFFFTMTKIPVPLIPERLLRFSYGMMAPYQGYSTVIGDLLAEGERSDGTWETIDLDPYYPMILGNQLMFRQLRSFERDGEAVHKEKYTELARLLRDREEWRGRAYEAVRLTRIEWPTSPAGFAALRREPFLTKYFITQVP